MQIIVDKDCTNNDLFVSVTNQIENILLKFLEPYTLTTLKYFVIADTSADKFYKALKKYANQLNTEIAYGDSEMYQVAGKCIEGFDDNGIYSQIIVVKSGLVVGMLSDLSCLQTLSTNKTIEETDIQWLGLMTIIHEFGHAIDNETFFNQKHTVDLRCAYDLANKVDRDEFFEKSAIALWSEFFAESFAYSVCPELRVLAKSKIDELLKCLENYRGTDITTTDRAYRILYLFALVISQNEKVCFDFSVLDKHQHYVCFLKNIESEMFRILKQYPNINTPNDFNIIKKVFYELCVFEYKQQ